MHKIILLFIYFTSLAFADPLVDYYSLIKKYPHLVSEMGDHTKGEIEIVLEPKKIQEIENIQKNRLLKKGYTETYSVQSSRVGLISEDSFWLLIRDAVVFPSGYVGMYNRLVLKSSLQKKGEAGVAVLSELEDGGIVLVVHYRHATRSWEVELPRGIKEEGETIEQAAIREAFEETGCEIDQLTMLGKVIVDSGLVNNEIPVVAAKVKKINQPQVEPSEAIFQNVIFTKKQIEEGLSKGFVEILFNKEQRYVSMKDSYLSYAVLQMMLKGRW